MHVIVSVNRIKRNAELLFGNNIKNCRIVIMRSFSKADLSLGSIYSAISKCELDYTLLVYVPFCLTQSDVTSSKLLTYLAILFNAPYKTCSVVLNTDLLKIIPFYVQPDLHAVP